MKRTGRAVRSRVCAGDRPERPAHLLDEDTEPESSGRFPGIEWHVRGKSQSWFSEPAPTVGTSTHSSPSKTERSPTH